MPGRVDRSVGNGDGLGHQHLPVRPLHPLRDADQVLAVQLETAGLAIAALQHGHIAQVNLMAGLHGFRAGDQLALPVEHADLQLSVLA